MTTMERGRPARMAATTPCSGRDARAPYLALALLLAAAALAAAAPADGQAKRVYFIGNSVTDTVNYRAFQQSVETLQGKLTWGRQMVPGCPLFGLWRMAERNPDKCGFTEKPFGGSLNALRNFEWDAVTLQPFDRLLANADPKNNDDQGDVLYCQKYLDLALTKSPNAQLYTYARWPRMLIGRKSVPFDKDAYDKPIEGKTGDWSAVDPWDKRWTAKYTGGWDTTNETADYFETLTRILRQVNPAVAKPLLLIPVGHVMYEFDKQAHAGAVPGFKGAYDLYKDPIHLTNMGSYLVGCTFYATLYKTDPKGFAGAPYKVTDDAFMGLVQRLVWQVVSAHPLAGVAPAEPIVQR